MSKKRGLGRGLEALLGDLATTPDVSAVPNQQPHVEGDLTYLALAKIQPGKYQPRSHFSEESLKELADSIRVQGVIQPIVVRTLSEDRYEIIAGERRFRAAKLVGLESIPALVRELPDEGAIAIALIENIQRENLNAIEEAVALQRLIDEFEMTHQQVANAVGKSRTAVTNLLRLLNLDDSIREMVRSGQLEMGHGRALLALTGAEQQTAAKTIAEKKLSVRDAEHLIRRLQNLRQGRIAKPQKDHTDVELERLVGERLKAKVALQHKASGGGKLIIKYKNSQHLKEIIRRLETGE